MESFTEVLELVKEDCKQHISDVAYNCWIRHIEPISMKTDTAIIFIKTDFQKGILTRQYMDKLKDGFKNVLGFNVDVIIATESDIHNYIETSTNETSIEEISKTPAATPTTPEEKELLLEQLEHANYEYTFDTFIVGSSNNFAYAACKAVAEKSTGTYNPLFIYGPSGLGKTHLLSAISNTIKQNNPDKNIISVSSETFTNELIAAISSKNINEFHNKYRKADILLVDDIQFIAGKESTQEEFFHTFNELHIVGKQIVLTSDRPPKDIKTLEERLKTRFEWGLITDVSHPDFETRIAIIRRKAELLQIEIPSDVAEFIANKLKTNIRQLEGAVKKIKAYKLLAGSPPSIAVAQTVIREILNDNQPIPVTVERIIEEVSKTYSVTSEDIRSNKRAAQISLARQIAMYVVREITQMSLTSIGAEFGGRDHATIVYALNQVDKKMEKDSHQKGIIEDIISNMRDK